MTRARDLADQADGVFSGDVTGTLTGTVNGLNPQASNMQPHNLIINGAMTVAQRGTSATVSDGSNEGYSTLDRWFLTFNSAIGGAVSFSQSTDAPDGFSKSLKVQCSTVDTSHTTNQYISVVQRIEAQDLQHLAYGTSSAKSMILSWRMKSATYSGPITVALQTQDGTSEYFVKSYAPTTSWAEYTCVIPPSTSATISSDNGEGLRVSFVLAGDSGSSIAASSDSTGWSTTRADYRSDVGNIVSNTSNEFYITGVQLEVGSTASPFAHENYADTLQKCQRYYWPLRGTAATPSFLARNNAGGAGQGPALSLKFPQSMRTAPTATQVGSWQQANTSGGAGPTPSCFTTDYVTFYVDSAGSGDCYYYLNGTANGFNFSAEL